MCLGVKFWFARTGFLCLWAGLLLGLGCRTTPSGGVPAIEAILSSDGNATLGEDRFPIQQLTTHLKHNGAGRATAIFLVIPPEMTPATMSGLSRDLRKAGFPKIIFKRPMKPDATVQQLKRRR